jgi:glycosyltransferase involved in cell wall biosynthesis
MKKIPNGQFFELVERAIADGRSVVVRVRGTSMSPALRDNFHRVVLVPPRDHPLRPGAIALFRHNGCHVLHRLVAVRGGELVFRGDNMCTEERVGRHDVVALVRSIVDPRDRVTDCIPRTRVLFFIESLGGGGAERILSVVAGNLDPKRFDVTVATVTAGGVYSEAVGKVVKLRPMIRTRWRPLYRLLYNLIYRVLPPRMVRWLFLPRGNDVEVAFCEGFATRVIAAGWRAARKIAWVHTDMENNQWSDTAFRGENEQRECYERFDRVVGVASVAAEAFRRRFGVEATVAYNPVDAENIRRAAEESAPTRLPAPPDGPTLFVSVGRLVEQKGFDRLTDIVGRLRDEGHNLRLWIVGEGARREILERMIAEKQLADVVTLWGFMENPHPLVAAADWFVCSSRAEGYSTAVTESLILGTPVVAVDCSGTRELLGNNGEWGVVTENNDTALLEAMRTIIKTPALRDEYHHKAVERGARFSLEQQIAAIEALLIQ